MYNNLSTIYIIKINESFCAEFRLLPHQCGSGTRNLTFNCDSVTLGPRVVQPDVGDPRGVPHGASPGDGGAWFWVRDRTLPRPLPTPGSRRSLPPSTRRFIGRLAQGTVLSCALAINPIPLDHDAETRKDEERSQNQQNFNLSVRHRNFIQIQIKQVIFHNERFQFQTQ